MQQLAVGQDTLAQVGFPKTEQRCVVEVLEVLKIASLVHRPGLLFETRLGPRSVQPHELQELMMRVANLQR